MVKTWQVVLATIAIFVAGLVTGGATALGLVKWIASRPHANQAMLSQLGLGRGQGPMGFGPQLMRNFANELDLTEDQKAKIAPIVKSTAAQLARDRRAIQLTTAFAIEKMQDQISEILTPEQRTKFEVLISKQRERLQQFRQNQQGSFQGVARPLPEGTAK
jgi:Spy/CpxP family protein refolding chaperone